VPGHVFEGGLVVDVDTLGAVKDEEIGRLRRKLDEHFIPHRSEAAARAKQNFRYLAEDAKARGASSDDIANHEKNGELVLNLEQSSLDELYAKPRPKDSPTGNSNGLCDGKGKKPGKRPGGDKPSKGAGMNGEIGNGW
jgi:hypothetical protein